MSMVAIVVGIILQHSLVDSLGLHEAVGQGVICPGSGIRSISGHGGPGVGVGAVEPRVSHAL